MDNLYQIAQQIGLKPRYVMEVGAAHPDTAQTREFIANGIPTILIEANPRLFYCLKNGFNPKNFEAEWPNPSPAPYKFPGFGHLPNVKLHNIAIYKEKGEIDMYECNASSFVGGVQSPIKINNGFQETDSTDGIKSIIKDFPYQGAAHTKIPSDTIAPYDNGEIDILAVDTEGCEYYALEYLVSRPKLICLETHGQKYINPMINEIIAWMNKNGYGVGTQTESDTLFVKI